MKYIYTALLSVLIITSIPSCQKYTDERQEAKNLEIQDIDFSKLHSGTYNGYYEGGSLQLRENECEVVVDSPMVSSITYLGGSADYSDEFVTELYDSVISKQSLQIDIISGATLSTNACLKAIEDALLKANTE